MNTLLRSFRREIFFIVTLKIVLLAILWKLCFSTPLSHHLKRDDLKHHLIATQLEESLHGY